MIGRTLFAQTGPNCRSLGQECRFDSDFHADRKSIGDVVGEVACGGAAGQAQQQMALVNKDGRCFASSLFVKHSPTSSCPICGLRERCGAIQNFWSLP
jgi:hypothetical protein